MMRKYHKSVYNPKNPQKYLGDVDKIVCRSSWERAFCKFLDYNSNVDKWASEELSIPYVSPKDGRVHRYFPDFYLKMLNSSRSIIEIKPNNETKKPNPPKRQSPKKRKKFMNESITFSVNQAKWIHASKWCKTRNIEFLVYTENHLRRLGIFI